MSHRHLIVLLLPAALAGLAALVPSVVAPPAIPSERAGATSRFRGPDQEDAGDRSARATSGSEMVRRSPRTPEEEILDERCRETGLPRAEALVQAVADEDSDIRGAAIRALVKEGVRSGSAVRAVFDALRDDDEVVRRQAVEALLRVSSDEKANLQALIDALLDDDVDVRTSAATEIAGVPGATARAVPALALNLDDGDCRVRFATAKTLGLLGDRRAVSALLPRLNDPDGDVRTATAEALVGLGDRSAVPDLMAALAIREDHELIHALGRIGGEAAIFTLIGMLGPDSYLDRPAVLALGLMGPEAAPAVPALVRRLRQDAGLDAYYNAVARTLARIGGREAARAILSTLTRVSLRARTHAVRALGDIGPAAAVAIPTLIPMIGKEREAIVALGKIASQPAITVPALLAVLEKASRAKPSAMEALGRFGPAAAAATPALIRCLGEGGWKTRQRAAYALGRIGRGRDDVIRALRRRQTDDDSDVRVAVACSLVRLGCGNERLLAVLVEAVVEDNSLDAADALAESGKQTELVIRKLIARLDGEAVRAAEILGNMRSRAAPALPALRKALLSSDWTLRYAAIDALKKITGR
jgi:HEAT repeat protein